MTDKKLLWKRDWFWSDIWTAYRASDGTYFGTIRPYSGGGVTAQAGRAHGHFMNVDYAKRFVEAHRATEEA